MSDLSWGAQENWQGAKYIDWNLHQFLWAQNTKIPLLRYPPSQTVCFPSTEVIAPTHDKLARLVGDRQGKGLPLWHTYTHQIEHVLKTDFFIVQVLEIDLKLNFLYVWRVFGLATFAVDTCSLSSALQGGVSA